MATETTASLFQPKQKLTDDYVKRVLATADPLVTDVEDPGTIWLNTTTMIGFMATDTTAGPNTTWTALSTL